MSEQEALPTLSASLHNGDNDDHEALFNNKPVFIANRMEVKV
jgi:hypothetical protein